MILGQRSLSIEIQDFQLTVELFPDDPKKTGRSLTITGTTKHSHFLYSCQCYMNIWESKGDINYKTKNSEEGESYIEYGQISAQPSDLENDINAFVDPAFSLTTQSFKDILHLLEKLNINSIDVTLSLYGLDLGLISIEDDKWPNGTLLSITGATFN